MASKGICSFEVSMEVEEDARTVATAALSSKNWVNLIAYVVNFGVTYGSLTGIFGKTNTDISAKYQTLVTPAGWAFAIWGPIFIWEGVFAVSQMLPSFRSSEVVDALTPWWWSACCFQVVWTFFFSQEAIVPALVCMLGILASLLGGVLRADTLAEISVKDFWLLRAPFSLHSGWIIAASALNASVLVDYYKASADVMLAVAIAAVGFIAAAVALFTIAAPRGDPIICLVAAWAFGGISAELREAKFLKDPARFNPYDWPEVVLNGLRLAAFLMSMVSLIAATIAGGRRVGIFRKLKTVESSDASPLATA